MPTLTAQIAAVELPSEPSPSDQVARAAFGVATAFTYAIVPPDATDDAPVLDHLASVDDTIAELLRVASSWA